MEGEPRALHTLSVASIALSSRTLQLVQVRSSPTAHGTSSNRGRLGWASGDPGPGEHRQLLPGWPRRGPKNLLQARTAGLAGELTLPGGSNTGIWVGSCFGNRGEDSLVSAPPPHPQPFDIQAIWGLVALLLNWRESHVWFGRCVRDRFSSLALNIPIFPGRFLGKATAGWLVTHLLSVFPRCDAWIRNATAPFSPLPAQPHGIHLHLPPSRSRSFLQLPGLTAPHWPQARHSHFCPQGEAPQHQQPA